MSYRAELMSFPLASVAQRCAHETHRFYRRQDYDPWFCFELFRRAIVDRCQQAWSYLDAQYGAEVEGWVKRHSAFPSCGEEPDYLVNCTFERMWAALSPDRFADFGTLPALLSYLKVCVNSVLLDLVRIVERQGVVARLESEDLVGDPGTTDVEKEAIGIVQGEAFWEAIGARLKNEKERQVVYGLFVLGLAPRDIYAQHPDLFCSVQEVYRVRENVLARLRRDDDLADEFEPDA